MLSNFVTAFLPRTKHLLISWLQLPSAVISESKKIKSVTGSNFTPYICPKVMGPDAIIFVFFECPVLSQPFHCPLSPSSRGSLVPCHFLHYRGIICIFEVANILPAILIPACASSISAFCMMYSAYKLNKQSDNIQP